jgi:putative FmdB family regulatory protein
MPVYEYVCDTCECTFQKQRKVTERQTAQCPRCKGTGRKVIGAVGVIFKGSGWHCTDYRKPEKPESTSSGSEEKPPSSSKEKAPAAAATSD